MGRTVLAPTADGKPIGMYSAGFAVDPARLVFVAGQVAMNAEGQRGRARATSRRRRPRCTGTWRRSWPRQAAASATSSSSRPSSCGARTGRRSPNGAGRSTRSSFRTASIRRTPAWWSSSSPVRACSSRWRPLPCVRAGRHPARDRGPGPRAAGARRRRRAAPADGVEPEAEGSRRRGRHGEIRARARAGSRRPRGAHARAPPAPTVFEAGPERLWRAMQDAPRS